VFWLYPFIPLYRYNNIPLYHLYRYTLPNYTVLGCLTSAASTGINSTLPSTSALGTLPRSVRGIEVTANAMDGTVEYSVVVFQEGS
jgi:hypothetical protein